jgi:hypothetical protein
MYTSVGVLQRDAPMQGHKPEFLQMQRQLAIDLATAVRKFNRIVQEDLPAHFEGYDPKSSGWPSVSEIKEMVGQRACEVAAGIERKRDKLERLQALYDTTINDILARKQLEHTMK